jgi:hypothetical protein
MTDYTVLYCDDAGTLIDVWDRSLINALDYTLVENEVNALEITLPQWWDWDWFQVDRILQVQRNTGAGVSIDAARGWLLVDWEFFTDEAGGQWVHLLALDGNDLLDRRIVAYSASTDTTTNPYTTKTDQADDMSKAVVRENLGALATDAQRQLTGLSVDADAGQGPSITLSFAWQNVFNALSKIAEASWERGTYLVFDTLYSGAGGWTFRTYTGQRGQDHRATSPDPRLLVLSNPSLRRQHAQERNYIYCGGQGQGAARVEKTATHAAWSGASRWARRELRADARHSASEDAVQGQAYASLYANRPRLILTGDIQEADGLRYGIDYQWGDLVTVQHQGYAFDCHITAVRVSYQSGTETIKASVRGEL